MSHPCDATKRINYFIVISPHVSTFSVIEVCCHGQGALRNDVVSTRYRIVEWETYIGLF